MIKFDYLKLHMSRVALRKLSEQTIALNDSLMDSMGRATETEKEVLTLLSELSKKDIPELIGGTERLLAIIVDEMKEADENAKFSFESR